MIRVKKIFATLCTLLLFIFIGSCQTPIRHWSFEGTEYSKDLIKGANIDTARYKTSLRLINGIKEQGIDLSENKNSTVIINALRNVKSKFSISFFFKGKSFRYQTLPKPEVLIQFGYPYIIFNSTSRISNGNVPDNWKINLDGAGPLSYDYYTNGEWHQFTFIVDLEKGVKSIFIDGKSVPGFEKKVQKGGALLLSGADGFRQTDMIDELSFYDIAINERIVKREFEKYYSNILYRENNKKELRSQSTEMNNGYDPLDFAPGYPSYSVQAIEQLKSFPAPRYSQRNKLPRNFPWMDITYLHRELKSIGGRGRGEANPKKAVEMARELFDKWNYYFEIPVLRNLGEILDREYSNPNTVAGALIKYGSNHPELKTSGVIMQVQGKPVHAGLESPTPFVKSQNLAAEYYLKDEKGRPIKYQGKNWMSPLAPIDLIYKDAATTVYYLKKVEKYLGRPIDMLNENGEYFGHMRSKTLLEMDPEVRKDLLDRGLSISDYNGWFQNRLDTAYKKEILRSLNWQKTWFTFYNVSAIQPEYWPSYKMRRTTNQTLNNIHYSTPSFYPAKPENWRLNSGPYNGYGIIAEGRKREIELGDKFFAPFVSAGWSFEENNIRPAQWLALLKAMMMLGAEYYHVGYFNVTGSKGWPDGKGPFDPRGYIYQAAMPAYAQAIGSRVFNFLRDGELLNPQQDLSPKIYSYRIKGSKENHLLLIRKLGKKYLIFGSIQPVSNKAGNVPNEETTRISLDEEVLELIIRRQGSVYIYDKSTSYPTLTQIDEWHQVEHPYYWSKDYKIEAELADRIQGDATLITVSKQRDYTNFETYVKLKERSLLDFDVVSSNHYKTIQIRIRALESNSIINLSLGSKSIKKDLMSSKFVILEFSDAEKRKLLNENFSNLSISMLKGSAEIDFIVIK